MVDYCLIPHEDLLDYSEFNVTKALDVVHESGCSYLVDRYTKLPDHSILHWKITLFQLDTSTSETVPTNNSKEWKKFNFSSMPNNFLQDENVSAKIMDSITHLQNHTISQNDMDSCYSEFVEIIYESMENCVPYQTINPSKKRCNGNHTRKPWWNDELSTLWDTLVHCERAWAKANPHEKNQKRNELRTAQKSFDRVVQRSKRQYWIQEQERMMRLQKYDQKSFWKQIGSLGIAQDRKKTIPMEVVLANGEISKDENLILETWKESFKSLLNPVDINDNVISPDMSNINQSTIDTEFNGPITMEEIQNSLHKAKNGKATGPDGLPIECFRNETAKNYLYNLFNSCFSSGLIPEFWKKSIVNPIPKSKSLDNRCPLNYRGISLACAVYKLYCSILNERLTNWVSMNQLIEDEQNGFRANRNCIDHALSLSMIIQTAKCHRKEIFAAYIDFSKAFDRVNRGYLWKILSHSGLNGKMMSAVKSLYNSVVCCVRINGMKSDYFDLTCGVKQGCILSPLLFNLFVNGCITNLKAQQKGVKLNHGEQVSVLAYADDIVILSEHACRICKTN